MSLRQQEVAGRATQFIDQGKGAPVLLVHGFPLDHTMWVHQLDELSKHHRVIAPDLPGFGQSVALNDAQSSTPLTMPRLADWLATFLDTIEIAEPIHYCGLSMGGYVGWEFASRHRHRLSHLIACNTRAASDSDLVRRARKVAAANARTHGTELLAETMAPKLVGEKQTHTQPNVLKSIQSMIRRTAPTSVAAGQLGMAEREDMLEFVQSIDFPTLFVAGQDDTVTPPDEMESNAKLTPGAKYHCFENAGHLVPMQAAVSFNKVVIDFFEQPT
ncbi:MAG: alpha/beta fold hydrolase [Planctomycetota bacterium]